MTRTELARRIAHRHGVQVQTARMALDAVLGGIRDSLCQGRRVEIRGFGTMRPRYYPAYPARDPRSGESLEAPAKVLPVFRPGRALLERIDAAARTTHEGERP